MRKSRRAKLTAAVTGLAICVSLVFAAQMTGAADLEEIRDTRLPEIREQLAENNLKLGAPIFLRIFKLEHKLELWVGSGAEFALHKTYDICSYSGNLGPKLQEGDMQSPEGFYFVTRKSLNPKSSYHLSFNLGFPNTYDRSHERTGSFLMVHGKCVSVGCYAMTDPVIEEIYLLAEAAFAKGQPFFRVHVFPFRMSEKNLFPHTFSKWYEYWNNLKVGHDFFETMGRPPNVEVANQRYVIEDLPVEN